MSVRAKIDRLKELVRKGKEAAKSYMGYQPAQDFTTSRVKTKPVLEDSRASFKAGLKASPKQVLSREGLLSKEGGKAVIKGLYSSAVEPVAELGVRTLTRGKLQDRLVKSLRKPAEYSPKANQIQRGIQQGFGVAGFAIPYGAAEAGTAKIASKFPAAARILRGTSVGSKVANFALRRVADVGAGQLLAKPDEVKGAKGRAEQALFDFGTGSLFEGAGAVLKRGGRLLKNAFKAGSEDVKVSPREKARIEEPTKPIVEEPGRPARESLKLTEISPARRAVVQTMALARKGEVSIPEIVQSLTKIKQRINVETDPVKVKRLETKAKALGETKIELEKKLAAVEPKPSTAAAKKITTERTVTEAGTPKAAEPLTPKQREHVAQVNAGPAEAKVKAPEKPRITQDSDIIPDFKKTKSYPKGYFTEGVKLKDVYGIPIEEPVAKAVHSLNKAVLDGAVMNTSSSGLHESLNNKWTMVFNRGKFSPEMKAAAEAAGLEVKPRNGLTDVSYPKEGVDQGNSAKEAFDKFADLYDKATGETKAAVEPVKADAPTPETVKDAPAGDLSAEDIKKSISMGAKDKKTPIKESVSQTVDDLKTNFHDRFAPIKDIVKRSGKDLRESENPATLLKRYMGGMGIADEKIEYELGPILKEAGEQLDDLRVLMIAERSNELAARGIGKTANQALFELQEKLGAEGYTRIKQLADKLRQFQLSQLREFKEVGGLSDEAFKKITESNQKYTPFNRVIDELEQTGFTGGGRDINLKGQPIKKIKGSELDIIDPLESIIRNTYEMTKAIEKQRTLSALVKVGEFKKIDPKIIPVANITREGQVFPEVMNEVAKIVDQYGGNIERNLKTGKRFGYFESAAADVSGSLEGTKLVTKFGTSKDTLLHEFGHLLDTKFGLRKNGFFDNEVSKELRTIADLRKGRRAYTRKGEEKIAEFVSTYFSDNATARKVAPITSRKFDKFLADKPELKSLMGKMKSRERSLEQATETIFGPSQFEPKEPHITLFEDGKKVYYAAPKEVAEAISGINDDHLNLAVQAMAFPATLVRNTATLFNVGFAVPNIIGDQLAAMVNSKYGGVPIYDLLSGFASVIRKDDFYRQWLRSGADQASFFSQERKTIQKTLKDVIGDRKYKLAKTLTSPWEALKIIGEFSEKGSRLGVFKRALVGTKKEGLSDIDAQLRAMVQSREATVDFAQRGSKMKSLNAIIPFLNARIQGSAKLIESFRKRPLQTLAIGGGFVTVPAMILYAHNRRFEEYDEIPSYIKDNNFIIMTGDEKMPFYKIPKREIGKIFSNPLESFLDYIYHKDTKTFAQLSAQILGELSPVSDIGGVIPTAFKVPIELLANYDIFRGRNIVSPFQKDLPPELQYNKKTSETIRLASNLLGKTGVHVSPAKLEYGIKGFTTGLGTQVIQGVDYLLGRDIPRDELPVLNRFFSSPADLTVSANKIYEYGQKETAKRALENNQIKQRIKKAIQSGQDPKSVTQGMDSQRSSQLIRSVKDDLIEEMLTPKERALYRLSAEQRKNYASQSEENAKQLQEIDNKLKLTSTAQAADTVPLSISSLLPSSGASYTNDSLQLELNRAKRNDDKSGYNKTAREYVDELDKSLRGANLEDQLKILRKQRIILSGAYGVDASTPNYLAVAAKITQLVDRLEAKKKEAGTTADQKAKLTDEQEKLQVMLDKAGGKTKASKKAKAPKKTTGTSRTLKSAFRSTKSLGKRLTTIRKIKARPTKAKLARRVRLKKVKLSSKFRTRV